MYMGDVDCAGNFYRSDNTSLSQMYRYPLFWPVVRTNQRVDAFDLTMDRTMTGATVERYGLLSGECANNKSTKSQNHREALSWNEN